MHWAKNKAVAMLCLSALVIVACSHSGGGQGAAPAKRDDDKVLNFYTWSDYIAPDTIPSFERLTGIKVNVSYFDTNEMLEARMLTGRSGFDVVVSAGPYQRSSPTFRMSSAMPTATRPQRRYSRSRLPMIRQSIRRRTCNGN